MRRYLGIVMAVLVQESLLSIPILQPGLQLLQCLEAMGDLVFHFLIHLGVPIEVSKMIHCFQITRLTSVLRIRKSDPSLQKSVSPLTFGEEPTKVRWTPSWYYYPLPAS
jgi:hypothetical protein